MWFTRPLITGLHAGQAHNLACQSWLMHENVKCLEIVWFACSLTQRAVEFKMGCVFCHQALHIDASTET